MTTRKIIVAAGCLVAIVAVAFSLTRKSKQERVDQFMQQASHFEQQEDYESAIISLRNALRLMPSYGPVHVRLARDYKQVERPYDSLKHYDAALRLGINDEAFLREYSAICLQYHTLEELAKPAGKLLELKPDDPDAHFWMARALAADRPWEAISHVKKGLDQRPDVGAYLLLADLHARNRNYEKAEQSLQGALKECPDSPKLMAGLAAVQVELGKQNEALRHIKRAIAVTQDADCSMKTSVFAIAADVFRRLNMNERSIEIYRQLVDLAPGEMRFRVALARRYIAVDRSQEAIELLQRSLDENPDAGAPRIVLVEALLRTRKVKEARAELDKLPSGLASTAVALYLRGSIFLALDDAWQAEPLLRRAAADAQGFLPAQIALGSCYWKMGLVQSAEAEFQTVLKKDPSNIEAALRLARCKQAQGDFVAAEALAGRVLSVAKNNKEARRILISCKVQRGEVKDLEKLLEMKDPQNASARDLLAAARALAVQGQTDEALTALEAAIRKNPDLPEAMILKARILQLAGKMDEAEGVLQALVAAHPGSEVPAVEYATFLMRAGKKERAHDLLLELAGRMPQSAVAHQALGEFHYNNRNLDDAVDSLTKAGRLAPKNIGVRRRLVEILGEQENFERARIEVRKMKKDFGEALEVLVLEGVLLLEEGHLNEARACFNSISRRWPKEADGHVLLGMAHIREENIAAAITAFETARGLAPRDVRVRALLRDAYLAAGLYGKAAEEAKQVVKLRPADEDLHRLAISLAGSRETSQARKILERLSSADTQAGSQAEYHVQLGVLLASEGKIQQAEEEMLKALAIKKTAATVSAACEFYWQNNKRDRARELIETVADDDQRLYRALLARHYTLGGDIERAESEIKEIVRLAPADPAAFCSLGDFYAEMGGAAVQSRFDDAAEAYRRALDLDPEFLYAKRRTATLFAKAGRLEEAERILAPLAEKHPNNVHVQARLVEVAIQRMSVSRSSKFIDIALKRATQLAEKFPYAARAHYLVALANYIADRPGRQVVETSLARALRIAPALTEARVLLFRVYAGSGRFRQAEKECRELLAIAPGSNEAMLLLGKALAERNAKLDEYEKLAEEFPGNAAAKVLLGVASHEERPARSAQLIREALGDSPTWEMLQGYAGLVAAWGRPDEAVSKLQTFLEKNPGFAAGYRVLANALASSGDLPSAVRAQRRAYELARQTTADLRRAVSMLVRSQDEDAALEMVREHLAKRPQDNPARLLLAQLLGKSGRIDEAVTELAGLLKEEPGNPDVRLSLATAYLLQKRYSDAAEHYEAVLQRDPSHPAASNNLAFILAEYLDRPHEAERIILPGLQRSPNSALLQDTYGWILYKTGKLQDAFETLEKCLGLKPDEPITMFHLAVVCEKLKKTDRARKLLRRALELDDSFEKAQEARELLAAIK